MFKGRVLFENDSDLEFFLESFESHNMDQIRDINQAKREVASAKQAYDYCLSEYKKSVDSFLQGFKNDPDY